jgi:hypothetical protein
MVTRFVVFGVGLICRRVCVGIHSSADVYLLWTPFGGKTEFVSGNCKRSS